MWRLMRWVPLIAGPMVLAGLVPTDSSGASGAAPFPPVSTPPDITLRQIHMIETRGGSKLWELRADRAEVHEREGYTVLSRVTRPVEVTLYATQGQLTCTANRATVDLTTKDVRLEGGVVARSDQGTELRTEALRWLAASRRLQTDQPVTVSRGGWLSRGRGLEAETDLEQARIFQNITSQLRSPATALAPAGAPAPRPAGRSPAP
ncbi:MAG: LPS export ABC transporter periplasmic protein LptC [candidate division NC10 bacterium]|nr:LPS export ABC transporter periplasmic protein LptC [candidate division NC10 bacterium]